MNRTERYQLVVAPRADVALSRTLPPGAAHSAAEFITGTLLEDPRRVGKPLGPPWTPAYVARRGVYRVVYVIDDATRTVTVVAVAHRSRIYRR